MPRKKANTTTDEEFKAIIDDFIRRMRSVDATSKQFKSWMTYAIDDIMVEIDVEKQLGG